MSRRTLAVEQLYGRSILNSMHAMWSVGAVIGGAVSAVAAGKQVPLALHFATSGAVVVSVALLASTPAQRPATASHRHPHGRQRPSGAGRAGPRSNPSAGPGRGPPPARRVGSSAWPVGCPTRGSAAMPRGTRDRAAGRRRRVRRCSRRGRRTPRSTTRDMGAMLGAHSTRERRAHQIVVFDTVVEGLDQAAERVVAAGPLVQRGRPALRCALMLAAQSSVVEPPRRRYRGPVNGFLRGTAAPVSVHRAARAGGAP